MKLRNLDDVGRKRLVILDMLHHRLRLEECNQRSDLVKVPSCKVISAIDTLSQGKPVLSDVTKLFLNTELREVSMAAL